MVHIVLPGRRMHWRKENRNAYYADTGIHLIIDEMKNIGADIKNMKACIIGGNATFENQKEESIGNKNVKMVISVLKRYEIPFIKQNVGSGLSYKVVFDISSGEVNSEKSSIICKAPKIKQDKLNNDKEIDKIISQIEGLKPDIDIAGKLLETVQEKEFSQQKIEKIISKDFVLMFQILRMCNSGFYGHPSEIATINDAIRILDKSYFKLICVLAGTKRHSESPSIDLDKIKKNIYRHSYTTALISRQLAKSVQPDLAEEAYFAGYLHSMGQFIKSLFSQNKINFNSNNKNLKLYINNSKLISEIVLTRWNFPSIIMQPILSFNEFLKDKTVLNKLTAIIHVACGLSHHLGINVETEGCINDINPSFIEFLGLKSGLEALFPEILAELRAEELLIKLDINKGTNK